jgi:hypothetical protein
VEKEEIELISKNIQNQFILHTIKALFSPQFVAANNQA